MPELQSGLLVVELAAVDGVPRAPVALDNVAALRVGFGRKKAKKKEKEDEDEDEDDDEDEDEDEDDSEEDD